LAALYGTGPDLGDCSDALSAPTPSPSPAPARSQRAFALVSCYRHRHRSYGLMRWALIHQWTSRVRRLYHRPHGWESFPALTTHPSEVAATRTPEGRLRASAQLLPQPHWPSSSKDGLGTLITHCGTEHPVTGALSGPMVSALQCSLYAAAPSVASLLGHQPRRSCAGLPRPVHPGFRLASRLLEAPDNATGTSWATPRVGFPPTGCVMLQAATLPPSLYIYVLVHVNVEGVVDDSQKVRESGPAEGPDV
jgi:hypothetical protein